MCQEVGGGRFVAKIGRRLASEIGVKWEVGLKIEGDGIWRWEVLTQII